MNYRVEEVREFVNEKLMVNGKLNGQRLSEKYFVSREFGFLDLFKTLEFGQEALFCYLNGVGKSDKLCPVVGCSNPRRFITFKHGFKEYCQNCGKKINTELNRVLSRNFGEALSLEEVVKTVKGKSSKYNTNAIKRLNNKTLEKLVERTGYLPEEVSNSERIFNIEHSLFELSVCNSTGCQKPVSFRSSVHGYSEFCSNECALVGTSSGRKLTRKHTQYDNFVKRSKASVNDVDYSILVSTKEDFFKNSNRFVEYTHSKCGYTYKRDFSYQGHLKCPKCYPIRSRVQFEIWEWLSRFGEFKFNDRKLISPKEVDILSVDFGFAVEYDSLSYHSSGNHAKKELNVILDKNIHVDKTNAVESNGVQLFRIFSNEWFSKRDIWKSVLINKMGASEKLEAHECEVKPLTKAEADEFCKLNHLQSSAVSSVRLGLEYSGELVQVMTFSKTRFSKQYEWEMVRFCSKMGLQIQGGDSRLLKHFEVDYSPESLVSYANRRWSDGEMYERLGFDFLRNSPPNYFYFKGGDTARLKSRNQFQKRKLENVLDVFDGKLSETENMYFNGFRKIYDCGNKVYVKRY